ncbi:hypothetical protein [Marinicellulosiphila megalodicopiae]|uniref:hypothetical protein n=1 Tax=Marinicellulosiphila megalodicopiae TaxID=2724896 RepID=UPI003BAE73B8
MGVWAKDQAEIFDVDTWKNLGNTIGQGASDAMSYAADYIPETYDKIKQSVDESIQTIDENKDNLISWRWWNAQVNDTVDGAVKKVKDDIEEISEFLEESAQSVKKLIKYQDDILELPNKICEGDARAVQKFIEGPLKDIHPDLSEQILTSTTFYIALELIEDHESALTYFAYVNLFMESVPPNFYAYSGGKAAAYIVIEIILLLVVSFLTAGVGTIARLATLAAKFLTTSTRVAKTINQAQKAQKAFKQTIESFVDSADILNDLGQKLNKARGAGYKSKGNNNGTLLLKKESIKRDKRCRMCKTQKHSTPRKASGGSLTYSI